MSCSKFSDGRKRCPFCGGFHPLTVDSAAPQGAAASILSLLTDAAQALQAAFDLARESGDEILEQVIRRGSAFVASSIDLTTQPALVVNGAESVDAYYSTALAIDEQGNVVKDRWGVADALRFQRARRTA